MSDTSNVSSPQSYGGSPYSSPSQQVPHITSYLTELTCSDNGTLPYLVITEQPQEYFRFRYVSEMVGTHGCLLGKTNGKEVTSGKSKTYPTVVLKNYSGDAIVRCSLVQHLSDEFHPHRLLEDDEDKDVSHQVPDDRSYEVAFAGIGIIHTGKKQVPKVLLNKYRERYGNAPEVIAELKRKCDDMSRSINLNIVRLKFTAHDLATNMEICQPVYSDPIHNQKSAATNDVKICRMSCSNSKPEGGVENFLLVEKVNKNNISVRFFEIKEGKEVWSKNAHFLKCDVHHQYAIVFCVPPYRDKDITSDVKVWVELVRPSDGRRSEAREFTYKPDVISKQNKKRKANSYSSFESNSSLSGTSIKSAVPAPALELHNDIKTDLDEMMVELQPHYMLPNIQVPLPASADDLTGDALLSSVAMTPHINKIDMCTIKPQYNKTADSNNSLQQISVNSTDLNNMLADNNMPSEEIRQFLQMDLSDYYSESFGNFDMTGDNREYKENSMNYMKFCLVPDSGRATGEKKVTESEVKVKEEFVKPAAVTREAGDYSAFYTAEDGAEVKKLLKELCEVIRNKSSFKKQVVKTKLERLFEMRLSNGDTFLHMNLCNNQQTIQYIVNMVHAMKMTHLLNLKNNFGQTVLHLAVLCDLSSVVDFLISKGCNPSIGDVEGNTPIHYAVKYQCCMKPLLEAIKKYQVTCDLNCLNKEHKTPLHLTTIYDSMEEARLLLQNGASYQAVDRDGRTPLHLAAFQDSLPITKALLEFVKTEDIDTMDSYGNTALQIVCGGNIRHNTEEIVKLLLEKKADPAFHGEGKQSAWKLAGDHSNIRDLMLKYITMADEESDDEVEYESLDEGDGNEGCLLDLSQYIDELASILDANGSWKTLASRLQHSAMLNWYESTRSPTKTLLSQVTECGENVSSKSLALLLEDIGQKEAADVIRKYT